MILFFSYRLYRVPMDITISSFNSIITLILVVVQMEGAVKIIRVFFQQAVILSLKYVYEMEVHLTIVMVAVFQVLVSILVMLVEMISSLVVQ